MDITITFESSVPREAVVLHAWEPLGQTWDARAKSDGGRFLFRLHGDVVDQRTVSFKFLFPYDHRWEPDDYVRRIPTRRVRSFWAFDLSPRVMIHDPYAARSPSEVTFFLHSRAEFAGGSLYLWKPGTSNQRRVWEWERAAATGISSFRVPVEAWMRDGFHFKFATASDRFEPERSNRVWRPADGDTIHVKGGQVSLRRNPLVSIPITVRLLFPTLLEAPPGLVLADSAEPYRALLQASGEPVPFDRDRRFLVATYVASVFPEAAYTLAVAGGAAEPRPFHRPVRIAHDDSDARRRFTALLGYDGWLTDDLALGPVAFVFHPTAGTAPIGRLAFQVAVGQSPAFAEIPANRAVDGSWRADANVFVKIPLAAAIDAQPPVDQRSEGPVSRWRLFQLADALGTELHTVDGRLGFVRAPTATATSSLPTGEPR